MLASCFGYSTSHDILILSYFSPSLINLFVFNSYLVCMFFGLSFSLCAITSGLVPIASSYSQEKASIIFVKKSIKLDSIFVMSYPITTFMSLIIKLNLTKFFKIV